MNTNTAKRPGRGRTAFDRFAEKVSDLTSGATFFTASLVVVVLWLPTMVVFHSVDTWQLVINTATSVLAFLLIALLQNSERRSDRAAGEKLDAVAHALVYIVERQDGRADAASAAEQVDRLRSVIRLEEHI